jgi:succinoglycan biosynthesis transport protein ExoP
MADIEFGRVPLRRLAARGPAIVERPATQQYVTIEPAAPPAAAAEKGFLETVRRLWRHRRLILACTILTGGVAAVAAWSIPALYVAEARVLVGVQGPRVLNIEALMADVSPDAERVQNEGFILQSRTLAKQVIDRLKLAENPDFNPALRKPSFWARLNPRSYLPDGLTDWLPGRLVDWLGTAKSKAPPPADSALTEEPSGNRMIDTLLSHVDVSTLGRSHVLSVKVEAGNPQTAASIANTLADSYLDSQRSEKINAMDRVDKFLMGRIGELREQVRKSDQAVEDYRRANGLYKSGTGSVTAQQLTELNSQLLAAQSAKVEAESRLHEAQEMRKGGLGGESVPEVLRSPLITALKQQQADSERRAAELSASYGERHQAMRSARAEAANIAGRVSAEVAKTIDGLNREARSTAARYDTLSQNFERLKSQMGAVNDKSIQLEALERDATVNRNLLEAMLNRAKQTMGNADVLQANAKLVSPAAPTEAPSFPPKALLVFLGTLGGLLVGAAVALVRESGDRTFRRADQIEATTGLPVIAMVPQVSVRTPPAMQVLREPISPYSEALRRLHIGVELSEGAVSPKTLLFTSAAPSEGKSVMVASLGRLLASNGKRILLIDCDWRSPRLHQIFHCSNRDGLASLLTDDQALLNEAVHHDALSGADVLPAGNWNPRHSHLLSSQRMRDLLEAFVPDYDFIILDAPPALVTADVLALARLVEKVVFVVRWGHTQQEAALEALKQIIEAQGDVAGVVMSRVVAKEYRRYASSALSYEYRRPASHGDVRVTA